MDNFTKIERNCYKTRTNCPVIVTELSERLPSKVGPAFKDFLSQSVDVVTLQHLGITDWEARDVGHGTSLDPILLLQEGPVCLVSCLGENGPGHWGPVLQKLHSLHNIVASDLVQGILILVFEGGIKEIGAELKISGEINIRGF